MEDFDDSLQDVSDDIEDFQKISIQKSHNKRQPTKSYGNRQKEQEVKICADPNSELRSDPSSIYQNVQHEIQFSNSAGGPFDENHIEYMAIPPLDKNNNGSKSDINHAVSSESEEMLSQIYQAGSIGRISNIFDSLSRKKGRKPKQDQTPEFEQPETELLFDSNSQTSSINQFKIHTREAVKLS